MTTLTTRQTEVLNFVRSYVQEHEYSPSVRDVAEHFGMVPSGAKGHLDALEGKGAIVRTPGIARSIRVCPPMT